MRAAVGYELVFGFCLTCLLAACGGGGSSALSPPFSPGKTPNASDPVSTWSQTATYDSAPLAGLICRSPQYPQGIAHTWGGTISQTPAANQSFDGQSGLVAVTSTIALQGCAPTAFDAGTEPVTETSYYSQLAPSGSGGTTEIVLVGSTMQWSDVLGNKQTSKAVYGNPGLVVGELPFQAGRTWSSAATRTIERTSSGTSTEGPTTEETLIVNADGSYSDVSLETGGTVYPYDSVTTVESSDASGSRTEVTQVEGASAPGPAYGLTLSAPSNNTVIVTPFGTAPVDPLLPTPPPGAVTPTPTPYPQYAWYPYVPSATHTLETITSTDKGTAALPASCNTSVAFPKTAELIETVDNTLDIWTGTTASTTDAYIDAHAGVLCANVTVQFTGYALGPTSADTTPTGSSTLTFTDALQTQTSAPPVFAVPAPARYLTLWR